MQEERIGKKIKKITKRSDFDIIVFSDGTKINYYYDDVDFDLGIDKEITSDQFDILFKLFAYNSVNHYAYKLISKKIYSVEDFKNILTNKFPSFSDSINDVISDFKKRKLLDDQKYVQIYFDFLNASMYGKYYIINFYRLHGINEKDYLNLVFDEQNEKEKARRYFESIKNIYVSKNFVKEKKKIYNILLKRGFSSEVINNVLDSLSIDKEKEIKLLNKTLVRLINTYDDFYINPQVMNKSITYLMKQGYSYKNILDLIEQNKGETNND